MGQAKEKKKFDSIVLAHHPSCEYFSHHTFQFRGRRLCMGCFIMYPSAAISLVILYILNIYFPLEYVPLLFSSLVLFAANAIRKLVLKDNIQKMSHVAFRVLLGLTLALAIMSVFRAPADRWVLVAIFVFSVAAIYNLYNGIHNLRICKRCPQYPKFPHCDGALEPENPEQSMGEHQI